MAKQLVLVTEILAVGFVATLEENVSWHALCCLSWTVYARSVFARRSV